jgi:EpsI family protein
MRRKHALVLTVFLLLQAGMFYGMSRSEKTPVAPGLENFPKQLAGWSSYQEGVIEPEVQEVLKADGLLTRMYSNPDRRALANIFIAYFATQRTGQTPHSPKNCLPGSGWVPSEASDFAVEVPGRAEPVRVNHYVVAKGTEKSVVLYWYQTPYRVIASEYAAKVYLVADSVRHNRTDTALVRIVVPVADGEEKATGDAISLMQAAFPHLEEYFPL